MQKRGSASGLEGVSALQKIKQSDRIPGTCLRVLVMQASEGKAHSGNVLWWKESACRECAKSQHQVSMTEETQPKQNLVLKVAWTVQGTVAFILVEWGPLKE